MTAPAAGEFLTKDQTSPVTLVPLDRLFDERYAACWKVAPAAG